MHGRGRVELRWGDDVVFLLLWACHEPDVTSEVIPHWCGSPVETLAYTEVPGLLDTTNDDPARKEHPPVAFADLDGDGDDDVLIADRDQGVWLHRNEGGFELSLVDPVTRLSALSLVDLDGDRDLDLFGGGKDGALYLWENDGDAGFARVGIDGISVELVGIRDGAFGDYDGDGDFDLYVVTANSGDPGNPGRLHRLLRNDGGAFVDASDLLPAEARAGLGWQASWFDLENDGDLDLFVANAEQTRSGPSRLFRNDGGTFSDVTSTCSCGETGSNMGTSVADFDGDGFLDLYLTNTGPAVLLANDGVGAFVDVTAALGAGAVPDLQWMTFGSVVFDHDNDGDLDLFAATGALHDGEPGIQVVGQPDVLLDAGPDGYTDIAADLGLDDPGDGRGVAIGMWDDDGFPELLVSHQGTPTRLWHPGCTDARSLVVELDGAAPNRFGIGARVIVTTDAGEQMRVIDTKPGWGAAQYPRAWFGLGDARVEELRVVWPDGEEQVVPVAEDADGRVVVTEG